MSETMKAGRELDAMVAEKIMGWTGIKTGIGTPPGASQPQAWHGLPVPLYSSDIAAAWQIVQSLRAREWRFSLTESPIVASHRWRFRAQFSGVGGPTVWAEAESVEHAICLAALRATEGK